MAYERNILTHTGSPPLSNDSLSSDDQCSGQGEVIDIRKTPGGNQVRLLGIPEDD